VCEAGEEASQAEEESASHPGRQEEKLVEEKVVVLEVEVLPICCYFASRAAAYLARI
jgi:hypothetical protein